MRLGHENLVPACSPISRLDMENVSVHRRHVGLALGIALASGTSLVLWVGLLQAFRWAAHAIF
jgi:hypothetical protein